MSLSEKLTYCTTKIISTMKNGQIVSGTGFFMNFNVNIENETYQPLIITNKHVVKGANKIQFSVCKCGENNTPLDTEKVTINIDGLAIIEHPDNDVDLCAIPLTPIENDLREKNIHIFKATFETSLIPTDDEIRQFSAMEEIIMIGYPDGLEDKYNNKPIIRRGITSTHMKNDYNGKKEFLIDMACFPGSSGSPIFVCNENSYNSGDSVIIGQRIKFLGLLYAGPQHSSVGEIVFNYNPTKPISVTNIPNNLGIVIKAVRVKELEEILKKMA